MTRSARISRADTDVETPGIAAGVVRRLAALGRLNYVLFAACLLFTPLLTFLPGVSVLASAAARLAVFAVSAAAGGLFLSAGTRRRSSLSSGEGRAEGLPFPLALAACTLLAAFVHVVFAYSQDVSTYPLTMGWSETSRYYYASLFFAERIYGADAAPTVLHPSRYLLQAVPFLVPGSPLWLHRLWQALLWVLLPALAAYALARRVLPERRLEKWLLAGAAFGYLTLGPVYYHLLVPVIVILWGFTTSNTLKVSKTFRVFPANVLIVALASAWAGISRINWFPVPGMLAALLGLLEQPLLERPVVTVDTGGMGLRDLFGGPRRAQTWRYLLALAGWMVFGAAVAFGAQLAYIAWSGNAAEQFTTSFSSDLLWSRLLPNPTYPPGILLGTVLVSLPAALIVLGRLVQWGWPRIHPVRLLGIAAILLALLAGGLVVSVKIGGGSNLHNVDAYLALLAVVGAYFAAERVAEDSVAAIDDGALGTALGSSIPATGDTGRMWGKKLANAGMALALVIVAVFSVAPRGPAEALPDRSQALEGTQTIVEAAEASAAGGGQVLFLSNRHLLSFGEMRGVALAPEYERVFLMEAAMSNDPAYLGKFYDDLRDHRFALIVSEPLSRQQKGAEDVFGAENDAWVKHVARYVLCYYEPVKTLRPVRVQLLAPRATPDTACP